MGGSVESGNPLNSTENLARAAAGIDTNQDETYGEDKTYQKYIQYEIKTVEKSEVEKELSKLLTKKILIPVSLGFSTAFAVLSIIFLINTSILALPLGVLALLYGIAYKTNSNKYNVKLKDAI